LTSLNSVHSLWSNNVVLSISEVRRLVCKTAKCSCMCMCTSLQWRVYDFVTVDIISPVAPYTNALHYMPNVIR